MLTLQQKLVISCRVYMQVLNSKKQQIADEFKPKGTEFDAEIINNIYHTSNL